MLGTWGRAGQEAWSGAEVGSWLRSAVGRGCPWRSRAVAAGWAFIVVQASTRMSGSWSAGVTGRWRAAWSMAVEAEVTGRAAPAPPAARAVVMARSRHALGSGWARWSIS